MFIGRARGRLGLQLLQDLLDPIAPGDGLVVEELDFGDAAEADALSELAAQERRGALERPCGLTLRLLVAHGRVVHPRDLEIGRDAHAREPDAPDPRTLPLP